MRDNPPTVRERLAAGPAAAVILASLAVVVVSSAIAWDGDVPGWERDTLTFINDWPDWLEPLMWVVQQPGVLFAPVVAGLVIVWLTGRWEYLLAFAAVLPLKLLLEKAIVKQLVERERPGVSIGPEIEVRGPADHGLSFPSGHSTTAFAMYLLIAAFVPRRWRWLPITGAVAVGVARLYYGEHNTLDVVAGAALGIAFATAIHYVLLNRWVEPT